MASGFRNLSFFMLGLLGALPSNMPRHAQLRCNSESVVVHPFKNPSGFSLIFDAHPPRTEKINLFSVRFKNFRRL